MGFTIVEALTLAAVGRDYSGCHKFSCPDVHNKLSA